jgi:hypothetical protein
VTLHIRLTPRLFDPGGTATPRYVIAQELSVAKKDRRVTTRYVTVVGAIVMPDRPFPCDYLVVAVSTPKASP